MRRRGTRCPIPPTNPLNQQRLNTDFHHPRGPARAQVLSDFWPLAASVASLVTGVLVTTTLSKEQSGACGHAGFPAPGQRGRSGLGGAATAAMHRAAKLAASSLQTPVTPNTGARVAQYERKDPLNSLSAAAAAMEEEEEEEEKEAAARLARAPVMQGREVGWGWAPGAMGG